MAEKRKLFRDLLADALDAANAYDAAALAEHKLSPSGFIRAACEVSGLSEPELHALRKRIDGHTPPLEGVRGFLGHASRWIGESTVKNMPTELRRIRHLARPEALVELPVLGCDLFQLFAVAVLIAAQRWPERFGKLDSWEKHQARVKELERQRDEAFEALEMGYEVQDLIFHGDADKEGRSRVTFKLAEGAVHVGPDAAERLVRWAKATTVKWRG